MVQTQIEHGVSIYEENGKGSFVEVMQKHKGSHHRNNSKAV
jgi:hypothetical protein